MEPLVVRFTDASTGSPTGWTWDFGDGATSAAQSPAHTYTDVGTYTVTLTATNVGGSTTVTKTGYITVNKTEYAPVAGFSASTRSGPAPLAMQFTDTSTNTPTSWTWDFGDGGTSTAQSPGHTYTAAGTYTVRLTASNAGGNNILIRTNYITVSAAGTTHPEINITPATSTVNSGETQQYRIMMTGAPEGLAGYDLMVALANPGIARITSVTYPDWAQMPVAPAVPGASVRIGAVDTNNQINAGVTDILLATVTVTGKAPGSTPIFLSAVTLDADGGNAITPSAVNGGTLIVGAYTGPVAGFHGTPVAGLAPLAVRFTDDSTGATAWAWDFDNDGTIDSTVQNPAHTYATTGTSTVKLTVTGPGGSDSMVKTGYITAGTTAPTAQFAADTRSGSYPLTVQFSDQSTGSVTSWHWDFGDGRSSSLQNPTHTFTYPGTFTVTLTAAGPGGSGSTTTTISATSNGPTANFIANPANGTAPLAVQFSDQSTGSITSWAWDFNNDGIVDSTVQNPVYTFAAGTYAVNLTVTGPGGSASKVRQEYIHAGGNLTADFTGSPLTGVASRNVSLAVRFTDDSTGTPTSWSWNFGNGDTVNATEQNPVAFYTGRPQKFTVTLEAGNGADSGSVTKTQYVAITPYLEKFPKYNSAHEITGYYSSLPADLDGDYVYEDINHNGRVDYDDVVAFYNAMDWIDSNTNVDIENYDYSGNGKIGFEDVVALNDRIVYQ
jgi:PKD repeat protein